MPSFSMSRISENQVTPEEIFFKKRRQMLIAGMLTGSSFLDRTVYAKDGLTSDDENAGALKATPIELITNYNNYYEFSNDKKAVKVLAQDLTLHPWTITVDGEVENPFTIDIDDLTKLFAMEERIYRFRCVEGWSMVVPWTGFSLARLIDRARPTSRARFVAFESVHRRSEMPGQRAGSLIWPYREGLRIDEAMHPLTFAVTGLYGKPLPKQNGAPLRIAVPWKYGFKNPKAIVHIRLVSSQPATSWNILAPSEYGFYGNVNPLVSHPRWSQQRENSIGEMKKHSTLMLNGYADQVAYLYAHNDAKALY
ncbi:protein-methionine-sulfoxide reductase catalytic subunit MsrP [Undibacterium sp. MH2W]|uniref:protein-methionine-sulfoxide reductase catalytic subunit MsrP n=1 Tax=Undibacterium sp. MH2W TaxID=3413044 RepID=UPI003BF0B981